MTVAVTLFNPMVYQISGFRWSFFDAGDVSNGIEPCCDIGFSVSLPAGCLVDVQNRVSFEVINTTLVLLIP